MLIDLSDADLALLTDALDLMVDRPGHGDAAVALLSRLGGLAGGLAFSRTGAAQEASLTDHAGRPPALEVVTALAEAAAGPENGALRSALRHYATLRALGPGWVAAIGASETARAALPDHVWPQLEFFLGEG